ncbi:MAG: (Na+)-NQR maturation NqrM [Rhizobacter sp.]|nr:(Na+)-NQR maturation NqrM [Rhizobacter sp.]
MSTLIASFIAIALAVAAMALGVLFGRAPIRGSCGGIGGGGGCEACSGRCERRREAPEHGAAARDDTC